MNQDTPTAEKKERRCAECGADMSGFHQKARFCTLSCKSKFNNRRLTRGPMLYDLCMAWRKLRGDDSLGNLCHQIGIYLDADDKDGRQSWNAYEAEMPWHIPPHDPVSTNDDG